MEITITIKVPAEGSAMEDSGVLEAIEALLEDCDAEYTWAESAAS